jgi:hypothetical protein
MNIDDEEQKSNKVEYSFSQAVGIFAFFHVSRYNTFIFDLFSKYKYTFFSWKKKV